jgi:hypothetical protein
LDTINYVFYQISAGKLRRHIVHDEQYLLPTFQKDDTLIPILPRSLKVIFLTSAAKYHDFHLLTVLPSTTLGNYWLLASSTGSNLEKKESISHNPTTIPVRLDVLSLHIFGWYRYFSLVKPPVSSKLETGTGPFK